MTRPKRLAVIAGARPNFIKAAPFFKTSKDHPEFQLELIHTGQHYDPNMSAVFFEELGLPQPVVNLHIDNKPYTEKIGRMFTGLGEAIKKGGYDGIVVFGDVNSTLAGGIAAAKTKLCPLIHVEAGLRSYDRRMPEEMNRAIVDHLSDLLFTTEPSAEENLLKEGINPKEIKYVGNILIENLEISIDKIQQSDILSILKLKPKSYIVTTFHREENTNNLLNLKKILLLLNEINKDVRIVFPIHPGTRKDIRKFNLEKLLNGLFVIEPVGYFEFLKLVLESQGVISDSGGIQEETSHLGVPCATIRDNTERPITLELGSNKLFKPDLENAPEVKAHLNRRDFKSRHIPFWDNKVSKRMFAALKEELL